MTKMNRRRFLQTAALTTGTLAGGSSLLAACGGSSPSSSSGGTVTLTVMYNRAEFLPTQQAQFEAAHPTIKIKQIEYDATVLSSMLAAGNSPDVVRSQGAPSIPNTAARGLALDLTPYIAKTTAFTEADLFPINDVYRWDGKTSGKGPRYGLVKDWSQDAMFWYNKKLFDQAKVPYPSATVPLSYQEWLEIGKKLTVRDTSGKIQVYGLNPIWGFVDQARLAQMLAQQDQSLWNEDFTRVNLTSPQALAVLQWYVDWAQAHVGPSPLDPDVNGTDALFVADRAAIMDWGYWFGGALYQKYNNTLPDYVGFAPAPQFGSTRVDDCFSGTGGYISANSQHKDEAWAFVEFFLGPICGKQRTVLGNGLPSFRSLLPDLPQALPAQKAAYEVQQATLPLEKVLPFSPFISDDAFETLIVQYIVPVMKGQASLKNAAQQLQTAVNQALQQGKQQLG